MQDISDKLIVALDVSTLQEAEYLVTILYPKVKFFKVGSQLFTACGPDAVRMIGQKGAKVFLDLKFHDIPNTVSSAVVSAASAHIDELNTGPDSVSTATPGIEQNIKDATQFPVFMMTVHTKGGKEMMVAAAKGAAEKAKEKNIKKPFIVGVTRLTSDENNENTSKEVLEAAQLAKESGLDGVVCAVSEAALIRKALGKDFLIVTPGIRPKGAPADDQKRTATVSEALAAGSDYLVVGRPILKSQDPLKAVEELV